MFDSIRNRLILIGMLVAIAVFSLWPRNVKIRTRGADGLMHDTTERKVALKQGLDLQGGIHLGLELDQSKGKVANPSDAIDRALKVIRTRIDEFGVAEPLVQKLGTSRIIVDLPGLKDPARAIAIVQRSAFLQFEMTDKEGEFRRALPAMDRALAAAGVTERKLGLALDSVHRAGAAPAAPGGGPRRRWRRSWAAPSPTPGRRRAATRRRRATRTTPR